MIDDHLRNLKSPLSAGLEHDHRNFQLFDEGPAALLQQRGAGEQQAVQPAEAVDSLLRSEPGFRRNGTDVTALPLEKISGLLPGYSQNLFHFGVAILLAVVQGAADEETAFLLTGMVDETAAALPPEDDAGRGKIVQGGVCGFERNFVLFCELRSGEKRRAVREFFPQNFRPDFFRTSRYWICRFTAVIEFSGCRRISAAELCVVCCNYTRRNGKNNAAPLRKNFLRRKPLKFRAKSTPTYSFALI